MADKSTIEKIIEQTPLALIIIGVVVFIIGAGGGVPLANLPVQITNEYWRAGLGGIGFVLLFAGLFLLIRENALDTNSKFLYQNPKKYGITINRPVANERVGQDVKVTGKYKRKPKGSDLRLYVIHESGLFYWPHNPVTFNESKKEWEGKVTLYGSQSYKVQIAVALVNATGQAFWDYYEKVGKQMDRYNKEWIPIDGRLASHVSVCQEITVERVQL